MAISTDIKNNFIDKFKEFESRLNGNAKTPLHTKRKEAFESFKVLGFPHAKNEEYKYTNIKKALEKHFSNGIEAAPSTLSKNEVANFFFEGLDANRLVFVNGEFKPEFSNIISAADKIIIKEFSEVYKENPELVELNFGKYANPDADSYVALNTAFSEKGVFIKVPKNKTVDKPVVLHFISDASQANTVAQPRNLILIEENAEVNIVEVTNSLGSHNSFLNVVTEIEVAESARVKHYKLQTEKDNAYQVNTTQVNQAANSLFTSTTITMGGALVRNNLNIVLDAERCESHMFGLYMLNGNEHVDNHTLVDHRKPNSFSNELYKGIMDDRSTGVFNGKIFVRQNAQKTNAFQSNKNILLSDNATINTKPQLEIWADDVKCSHGATTGQLDEDQVFYLRARGISEEKARIMLLYAFAKDVIDQISIEPLKDYFFKVLSERLQNELD